MKRRQLISKLALLPMAAPLTLAISKYKVAKDIGSLLTRTEKQAVQNDPINQKIMVGNKPTNTLQNNALLSEIPMLYGSIDNAEEKLATAAAVSEEITTKGNVIRAT